MFELYKTTLQLMKKREAYYKLKPVVNKQLIDEDVRRALNVLDNYWTNYADHDVVVPETFLAELNVQHPELSEAQHKMYAGMADIMMQEPDEATAKGLMRSLRTLDFAHRLEQANELYQTGSDMDLHSTVRELLDTFESDISRDEEIEWVQDSIEDIIEKEQNGFTIPWFLDCLRGSFPSVRTGKQVILAARPGKGKTSFCAAQAVYTAATLESDRPILWFNNEGKGSEIKGTLYRAALQSTFNEIIDLGAVAAREKYARTVGGVDRIRIFDVHGRDYRFLEKLIAKHSPLIVFFDMLDNVHGFSDSSRTDLRLEALYQWAREQCVIHDFLSIPTSQISMEGEGLAWCDQSMLKDSKTAKQGACEAIITMGAVNNMDRANSRYFYIPKGKHTPDKGYRADCVREVIFDGARCVFKEPENPELPNA